MVNQTDAEGKKTFVAIVHKALNCFNKLKIWDCLVVFFLEKMYHRGESLCFGLKCVISLLVLYSASRGFPSGTPVVPSPLKTDLWFDMIWFDLNWSLCNVPNQCLALCPDNLCPVARCCIEMLRAFGQALTRHLKIVFQTTISLMPILFLQCWYTLSIPNDLGL